MSFDVNIADTFKIRPSQCGRIMGGSIGLSSAQEVRYTELMLRRGGEGKALTNNMDIELDKLILALNNPEISQGSKTYVEEWLKEKLYGVRTEISSKYFDKGNLCEDDAIQFYADQIGEDFLLKNNRTAENDWCKGTPDIVLDLDIVDIKCPWTMDTFPLFDDEIPTSDYYYQLICYMWMFGKQSAQLAYCLMNTPMELVEKEAKNLYYSASNNKSYDEVLANTINIHTFDHLEPQLRLRVFEVKQEQSVIDEIKLRVDMCRKYARQRIEQLNKQSQKRK